MLTIKISGPQGSGKTRLMNHLGTTLDDWYPKKGRVKTAFGGSENTSQTFEELQAQAKSMGADVFVYEEQTK